MHLTKFQVTNFRSVIDSGWIDAERVTALIGVNESGKTNLLLPLWKLNPAREGEIKPTSDYPKANYAAIKENPDAFTFVTAEFEIPDLAAELATLTGADPALLDVVRVSRTFSGSRFVEFPKYDPRRETTNKEVLDLAEQGLRELDAIPALVKEGDLKDSLIHAITASCDEIRNHPSLSVEDVSTVRLALETALPPSPAATSSIVPRFIQLVDSLAALEERLTAPLPSEVQGVGDRIIAELPKFVYFSNYGNLDSEIYLPHVVQNLKRENLGAREAAKARTLRVLFNFVRLQPAEILELGRDFYDPQGTAPTDAQIGEIANKKRERTILLNSASTDLTKKFREWWKQGDYTFDFQADGDHFRIWVSDRQRPEKVELEDRSSGLQWFLSFYLIFLVESSGAHRNAILLLDEPGLSLHPLAQRDLSAFFEGLAATNQIIYTTHSPFLVDADMLDRARKVYVAPDGSTKASADLRRGSDDPRKSGATYAIYSALNMNVAESMLYGCDPVIVEGPSDQHYLTTIKTLLIGGQLISPRRELVFPPSHGARNAKVISSILSGRDEVLPYMLLDGDEDGLKMATDLQNGAYQGAKDRILLTDKYVGFAGSEVEDLIPPSFLIDVVDRWQRGAESPFSEVAVAGKPIIPQLKLWAASQGISLDEGWKVDLARQVKKRALSAGAGKFEKNTLNQWTQLFSDFSTKE